MKPQAVTDVDIAFPTSARSLLPKWDDIPDEFKRSSNPWARAVSHWFFRGMKGAVFVTKEGVDKVKALRHLQTCMGSFEPKHEHKVAGCAYLLSQWFESVEYGDEKRAP